MTSHRRTPVPEETPGPPTPAPKDSPRPSAGRRRRIRRRRPDYPRSGRPGVRRWIPSWRQVLALVLLGIAGLTGVVGYAYAQTEIPADLNSFATQQNNVYYWADGTEMARTGLVNRQDVPLDQIPESVQWAVLSAENQTFYSDPGISLQGIARAVYRMSSGGDTQGGSTITQQYVKNAYLSQRQTTSRKITEIFMAIKLDRQMTKQQILSGYLNTSWFGRGAYGIQRAANAYYGKDVSKLNPSEGAVLASLLKGAGLYDPAISPENHQRAVERWAWVLERMVKGGKLSAAERAKYTTFPEPQSPPKQTGLDGQVGYLVDTAKAYVESHTDISPAAFDLGGHQIFTTFEKPKVTALSAAVEATTKNLDPVGRPADQHVHVGAASVAPDGRVLALYGGPDYLKQGFDNANASNVPIGSAFTPFVYAAALGQGVQHQRGASRTQVLPSTKYNGNDNLDVMTPEGPYWSRNGKIVKAVNDNGKSWGDITLRSAVEQSVNSPLMQLGMDVGLDRVRQTAVSSGLLPVSMGASVPGFSLGNSTPSALRTASAYETFATGGQHTDPYSVLRVTRGGVAIDLQKPSTANVLNPEVAGEVNDALVGAVRSGSSKEAQAAGPGVAGKTGTTADHKAGWFVGYSGQLSTAVTVFRMDPKTLELLPLDGLGGADPSTSSAAVPTGIWTTYMKAVAG